MKEHFNFIPQIRFMYGTSKLPDTSPKVVKKGFRARKGEVTEKPETSNMIKGLRKHWIRCGKEF